MPITPAGRQARHDPQRQLLDRALEYVETGQAAFQMAVQQLTELGRPELLALVQDEPERLRRVRASLPGGQA
jgi:hypothetical protein